MENEAKINAWQLLTEVWILDLSLVFWMCLPTILVLIDAFYRYILGFWKALLYLFPAEIIRGTKRPLFFTLHVYRSKSQGPMLWSTRQSQNLGNILNGDVNSREHICIHMIYLSSEQDLTLTKLGKLIINGVVCI